MNLNLYFISILNKVCKKALNFSKKYLKSSCNLLENHSLKKKKSKMDCKAFRTYSMQMDFLRKAKEKVQQTSKREYGKVI